MCIRQIFPLQFFQIESAEPIQASQAVVHNQINRKLANPIKKTGKLYRRFEIKVQLRFD